MSINCQWFLMEQLTLELVSSILSPTASLAAEARSPRLASLSLATPWEYVSAVRQLAQVEKRTLVGFLGSLSRRAGDGILHIAGTLPEVRSGCQRRTHALDLITKRT